MKILLSAVVASATVFGGTAYAAASAPLTHAQVIEQMQQARAAGLMSSGEQAYPDFVTTEHPKSRAEVRNELSMAIAHHQISNGEQAYPPATMADSSESRVQVETELSNYKSTHSNTQIPE